MSEIYHGETYDARLEKPGWATPGFDDGPWSAREGRRAPQGRSHRARRAAGPPDRGAEAGHRSSRPRPARRSSTSARTWSAGCGSKVQGPAGTTVTLRHAEVLDKDGNFYTANLRSARGHACSTRSRAAAPRSSSRTSPSTGFATSRWTGYPGELTPDSLTGIVIHSDMPPTGQLRDLESAHQPAPAQHRLGPEGQLPRRPHRLPAARRAPGLDRRRAGLRPHRRLQHGRGRLLHQVAARRGRRPARERQRPPRRARRADRPGTASRRAPRAGPTRR